MLGILSRPATRQESGEVVAGSRSGSKEEQPPQSNLSQELESSMKDELLKMQFSKIQHELNTLPKFADLDRQREIMIAELAVVSDKAAQSSKESEDKLHSALGSATEELRDRLQRIGDDLLKRLDSP